MKMQRALLVGAGGFCGSLVRQRLSKLNRDEWPYGTLCANLIGAFVIGILSNKLHDERARLFVLTGGLGAFTTFSTFTFEATDASHRSARANAAYVFISVILGLCLVSLGRRL